MTGSNVFIGKLFAPRVIIKALETFDRATTVIVLSAWSGALLIMLVAVYTLALSVNAEKDMAVATAQDPLLPQILSRPPEQNEMEELVDRLTKRFPDINLTLAQDRSVLVSATSGEKFRTWLTVLSYIDTVSPGLRWQIKEFCVGSACASTSPMQAALKAEKITFSKAPQS